MKKIESSRRGLSSTVSCALILMMLTLVLRSIVATGCTGSVSGNDDGDADYDAQDAQAGDSDANTDADE